LFPQNLKFVVNTFPQPKETKMTATLPPLSVVAKAETDWLNATAQQYQDLDQDTRQAYGLCQRILDFARLESLTSDALLKSLGPVIEKMAKIQLNIPTFPREKMTFAEPKGDDQSEDATLYRNLKTKIEGAVKIIAERTERVRKEEFGRSWEKAQNTLEIALALAEVPDPNKDRWFYEKQSLYPRVKEALSKVTIEQFEEFEQVSAEEPIEHDYAEEIEALEDLYEELKCSIQDGFDKKPVGSNKHKQTKSTAPTSLTGYAAVVKRNTKN
jgi:hypothetical protein